LGAFGSGPWAARAHHHQPAVATAAAASEFDAKLSAKVAAAGAKPHALLSSSAAAEEAASAAAPLIAAQRAALQALLRGDGHSDGHSDGHGDGHRNGRSKSSNRGSGGGSGVGSLSGAMSGGEVPEQVPEERRRGAAVAAGGHWSAAEQAELLRLLAADALAAPRRAGAWASLPFSLPPGAEPTAAAFGASAAGRFSTAAGGFPLPPLPPALAATLAHLSSSLGGQSHGVGALVLPVSATSARLVRVVSLRPLQSADARPMPMPHAMRAVAEAAAAAASTAAAEKRARCRHALNSSKSSAKDGGGSNLPANKSGGTPQPTAPTAFLYSPFAKAENEDELWCAFISSTFLFLAI